MADSAITKPFKYRSINETAKKQILEGNRSQLEQQHYSTAFRVQVLKDLPQAEDNDGLNKQRESEIAQMEEQLAIWEGMIERYNDELLTLSESIDNGE